MEKNRWLSKLRQARASELKAGGIWYLRNDNATFSTVTNELCENEQYMSDFRKWVKQMSQQGRIYLRLDKPNYPLTVTTEIFTQHNIKRYENQAKENRIK